VSATTPPSLSDVGVSLWWGGGRGWCLSNASLVDPWCRPHPRTLHAPFLPAEVTCGECFAVSVFPAGLSLDATAPPLAPHAAEAPRPPAPLATTGLAAFMSAGPKPASGPKGLAAFLSSAPPSGVSAGGPTGGGGRQSIAFGEATVLGAGKPPPARRPTRRLSVASQAGLLSQFQTAHFGMARTARGGTLKWPPAAAAAVAAAERRTRTVAVSGRARAPKSPSGCACGAALRRPRPS
jgi:hypothetical protein